MNESENIMNKEITKFELDLFIDMTASISIMFQTYGEERTRELLELAIEFPRWNGGAPGGTPDWKPREQSDFAQTLDRKSTRLNSSH